ncbi:MAG: flagellar hook-associated protein FlgK [Chromatiales bacterium]|nr:flagellar hook-associated protein FlgK [Chromatiales bacterium]
MADLLGIGTSGLLAYQSALTTTSHNISNLNTEGYSRQRVELATRIPERTGAGFFGSGVNVVNVQRYYDQFITENVWRNTSEYSALSSFHEMSSQVDNLVADTRAGLTPMLEEFFAAVQDVANNPTSIPARQVLLSSGESLASRFAAIDQRLATMQEEVNAKIEFTVKEINQFATSIADLNKEIASAIGVSGGKSPNDLLDQRDHLLLQLSERVQIATVEQDDGMMNVFVGNGQSLVVGATVSRYQVLRDLHDPYKVDIYQSTNPAIPVTSYLTDGVIGGVVRFEQEVLEPARASLGQIAAALSMQVNHQHQMGVDLTNNVGGEFFANLTTVGALASSLNNPATTMAIDSVIDDPTQIRASDYLLLFRAGSYTMTRRQDNVVVATGATIADINLALQATPAEGFTLIDNGGAINTGDSFLVRPIATAADKMAMQIINPERVAAASPVRTWSNINNVGDVLMSELTVDATATDVPVDFPMAAPVGFTYTDITNEFIITPPAGWTLLSPAGSTLLYNSAVNDGNQYSIVLQNTLSGNQMKLDFRLSGDVYNSDALAIESNRDGFGDNSNALELSSLQTLEGMLGGTATYQSSYGRMVSDVGTKTHFAEVGAGVAESMLNQAVEKRESLSGVNMDEEAANLIAYQQAYQATAKIITVADELFQTLLGAVGR